MVGELLELGRSKLADLSFAPPTREAHLLLGHVLGLSEAQVLARSGDQVPDSAGREFIALLDRRTQGEPVAYLLGQREFYGRTFRVDSRVLIPRPETEHLVEAVLALDLSRAPRILDLGTGSGCIASTLAAELPGAFVVAIDRSAAALDLAWTNIQAIGVGDRVHLAAADLATAIRLDSFDVVVSNPPYVGHDEKPDLSCEVLDFEPHSALFPPGESDSIIRRLIAESTALRRGAHLVFEIGHRHGGVVQAALDESAFELDRLVADYQDIPRVAIARKS